METLISSRLFGHFAEPCREGKTITENKVTDAYGEFISQLSLLANGEQAVIDKLRHLRILELELALYRDIPGHRPEHIMEIYQWSIRSVRSPPICRKGVQASHPYTGTVPPPALWS